MRGFEMELLWQMNLYIIYVKHTIISLDISLYGKVLGHVFFTLVHFFVVGFGLPVACLC